MAILDIEALRRTLSFDVSNEELDAFEPQWGSPQSLAGVFCNNAGCKNPVG
jgi:hypothetical protein